jgi:hypothetical protein
MKITISLFVLFLALLSLGCEKTVHEVQSSLPLPNAAAAWR